MTYLDLTLPTPAENLACEEALLDWCEADRRLEALRFWAPEQAFVALGYGNRAATEADLAACAARGLPVLRRLSGGGAVVQGPGCLNYALVLQVANAVELQSVAPANAFVLERHRQALEALLGRPVQVQGRTDLTIDGRKFSGNAQRRKRQTVLLHGTFLVGLDLELVAAVLRRPSREPAYRAGRPHREFLTNLGVSAAAIKEALRRVWGADEPLAAPPLEGVGRLARDKYAQAAWNLRL
jgi:lipoate-protein ligase A